MVAAAAAGKAVNKHFVRNLTGSQDGYEFLVISVWPLHPVTLSGTECSGDATLPAWLSLGGVR